MELAEVSKTIENIGRTFEEFKATNDRRLKAIEAGAGGGADREEKLEKLSKAMDENIERLKALETAANRAIGSVDEAEAKAKKEQAEAKGKLHTFLRKGQGGSPMHNGQALEVKALSSDSNADGGFLVYPQLSTRIVEKLFETSPIRQLADVETIATDELDVPVDIDEAGSGWVTERQSRSVTTSPQIRMAKIPAHELEAMPIATQKQLDDSMWDVEAWLAKKVGEKFGRDEATAFVTGTGVGKPRGFTTYASGTSYGQIEQVTSGSSGAVTADGIIALLYALKEAYAKNASFLAARATVLAIRKLKDSQNRYLWEPNMQVGQPEMLLGRPIFWAADMAAVAANSLSVACGDFKRGYKVVDRMGVRVLRDPFTSRPNVQFYTTKRVGGDVVDFEAIKLLKLA
jgi:HK97 family phage major capsid protein